ncbi:MAG: SulP family inorganic anion transporter [Phaeodactylibacter sp.]|nr:SulP family inorganic anion transporter [Phaeodactylibacter sp.]MCB9266711.1 SulP family inorganic anion transporter [Lewinellaceae bacterium]MCB9289022.1 SulP family inorganic anion transporter [Lewinellaceae bacterium]
MLNILKFNFSHLKGDFFGGLTAGIVALPLALAFGEQTELGAIAGLYGAIAIGVLAALFGGTPTQISGPTAPMTVVSAVVIADAITYAGNLETAFPIIIATFFLAGFMESLLGVFRLGKYVKYIPYPVVSGFMSGIGVIIVITQVFPFFGVSAPEGGPTGTLRAIHEIPEIVNIYSVGAALITIGLIYLIPRFTKKVPSTLVALILVSLAAFFILPSGSVLRLNSGGPIPTGLPELHFGFIAVFTDINHVVVIFEYAVTLAFLGAIDSLLTSIVADNITKTKHDSDQELIGQGIGNMGAAVLGGLPGAGATMRTVINANSGGKTKISGMIAGLFLLVVLLGIGSLVGQIPNAVLAGILITVGIGIIDYKGLRHIGAVPRSDAFVMIAVLLLTVFVDLLVAVGAGMVLSALLFMKKISDVVEHKTKSAPLKDFAREVPWRDEGNIIDEVGDRVYIKHLDGPLFFGFASRFQDMVKALPKIKTVVIRMDRVPYVDQSGLYAMEEAVQELQEQGILIVFTGLHGQPLDMFRKINLIPGLVSEDYLFETFEDCINWLKPFIQEEGLQRLAAEQANGNGRKKTGKKPKNLPQDLREI